MQACRCWCFRRAGEPATGELKPFLSGAAYLAIRAQVPLVPIALKGVYDLLPIHTHHFYPGELTVRVGEPIETKGMTVEPERRTDGAVARGDGGDAEKSAQVEAETLTTVLLMPRIAASGGDCCADQVSVRLYTDCMACPDCDS